MQITLGAGWVVSPAELRRLLTYDPLTGEFRWLVSLARKIKIGDVAGSMFGNGYRRITIHGHHYLAHRVAWAWMTGDWPPSEVDHINRLRADNRWTNLRAATTSQNRANIGANRDSLTGVRGVTFERRRSKWLSRLFTAGRSHHLGYFDTKEEAAAAYRVAAERLFGEFAS